MKTIKLSGTYTVECSLKDYPVFVDDEEYALLEEFQEGQNWEALDSLLHVVLDGDQFVLDFGTTEFKSHSPVNLNPKEEEDYV